MATPADLDRLIADLRGQIKALKRTVDQTGGLSTIVSNVEKELDSLEAKYKVAQQAGSGLPQIQNDLEAIDKALSLFSVAPPSDPPGKMGRIVAVLSRSAPAFGVIALGVAFLFTILAVAYTLATMGAAAWQTIPGGRAVLLLALTFAFVTFGGALLVTPLFAEGALDERFRRSREIFLLFAGMFSTVVGFYFASAINPSPGSSILLTESFDASKAEIQVAVAGGKPPYVVELEYGDKDSLKRKPPQSLENPGTVKFTFSKEEWPLPITIKARDSADARAVREVKPDRDELLKHGFRESKSTEVKKEPPPKEPPPKEPLKKEEPPKNTKAPPTSSSGPAPTK